MVILYSSVPPNMYSAEAFGQIFGKVFGRILFGTNPGIRHITYRVKLNIPKKVLRVTHT